MAKKTDKKWYIVGGIAIIVFMMAFSFKAFPANISGAYIPSEWTTSFDASSSTNECKNTDSEFERVTELLPLMPDGSVYPSKQPVKTFCNMGGRYDVAVNKYYTDATLSSDTWYKDCGSPSDYSINGRGSLWSSCLSVNGKRYQVTTWQIKSIYDINTLASIDVWDYSANRWNTANRINNTLGNNLFSCCGQNFYISGTNMNLKVVNPDGKNLSISYTIPRDPIPDVLHYRTYSCPLPEGYMLAAESFGAGNTINKFSFRYPVNYFCAKHPVIITDVATSGSFNDVNLYQQLVSGDTLTVPAGKTYTFFYGVHVSKDMPVLCEQGTYDVNTQKCVVQPGILFVCSVGQFDPAKGLCVVQPSSINVCPAGGRYDTALNACIFNPPLQAVCSKGIYNPDSNMCEYKPPSQTLCDTGFVYNSISDKCVKTPERIIICPSGYTYDQTSDKCFMYATTQIQCSSAGATYDPTIGKCIVNPPTQTVCTKGTYDSYLNVCIYTPDFSITCARGNYDAATDKCIYIPTTQAQCDSGTTWNANTGFCEYAAPSSPICLLGAYNPVTKECETHPDVRYLCINGIYNEQQNVCVITPEVQIVCGKGEYSQTVDKCVYQPSTLADNILNRIYLALQELIKILTGQK